jgi:hypothetical protein
MARGDPSGPCHFYEQAAYAFIILALACFGFSWRSLSGIEAIRLTLRTFPTIHENSVQKQPHTALLPYVHPPEPNADGVITVNWRESMIFLSIAYITMKQ